MGPFLFMGIFCEHTFFADSGSLYRTFLFFIFQLSETLHVHIHGLSATLCAAEWLSRQICRGAITILNTMQSVSDAEVLESAQFLGKMFLSFNW